MHLPRFVRLAAMMALVPVTLPLAAHGFFSAAAKPCDVHAPRRVEPFVLLDPQPSWHELLSLSNLCYVDRYVRLKAQDAANPNVNLDPVAFFPDSTSLYPGFAGTNMKCDVVESLIDGAQPAWPVCWPGGPPPSCEDFEAPEGCAWDFGYRYPRRSTSPQIDFQPADDSWPVCATADLSVIRSYPGTSSCSDGPNGVPVNGNPLQELGRCVASAHLYERLETGTSKYPAAFHYSYVPSATACPTPCAHDYATAVWTCRSLCTRYFGQPVDFGDPDGTWTGGLVFDPMAGAFRAAGVGEAPMGKTARLVHPEFPVPDRNLLFQCMDACGPPYVTRDPFDLDQSDPMLPASYDSPHKNPPWVSNTDVNGGRYPVEKHNHWHFVLSGRWNPSKDVHGALRSYAVNIDSKEYAPLKACEDLVDHYCASLPLDSTLLTACRRKPWPDDPNPPRDWYPEDPNDKDDARGFCAMFNRGRYLCDNTCTAQGGDDADIHGWHSCGAESPETGDLPAYPVIQVDRPQFTCGRLTATCELASPACPVSGSSLAKWNKALCRKVSIIHPLETPTTPVVPVSSLQVTPVVAYLDGYARSMGMVNGMYDGTYYDPPVSATTGPRFVVQTVVPNGMGGEILTEVDRGPMAATACCGWLPVWPHTADLTSGVVNRITVTFPAWPASSGVLAASSSVDVMPPPP